ncbi:hypothetical protein GQ457_02G030250 [Hibiscus cannabinus]
MDSKMNHVCYCGVRSKLTTSWTYENLGRRFWGCGNYRNRVKGCKFFSWYDPTVTEMSKAVIVRLLKKLLQWSKRERMKEFLEFCFLVLCFWWVLFWEKTFFSI